MFSVIKTFLAAFTTQVITYILSLLLILLAKDKNAQFFTNIRYLGWTE